MSDPMASSPAGPNKSRAGRRATAVAAGFVGAVLIAATAVAPALAGQASAGGRIAYGSDIYGSTHNIFTVRPDGSGVRQLTFLENADGAALQASWSPDGTQIVFRERPSDTSSLVPAIYLMNADGSGQHVLFGDTFNAVFNPTFSPDGTHVAFTRCPNDFSSCAVYTIKTNGTGLTAVTHPKSNVYDFGPQYSPDGRTIAFAGFNRPGDDSVGVYFVGSNGGNPGLMTDPGIGASDPAWSPDGSHLTITVEEAVWKMNADGSGLVRLSSPGRSHDGLARWSPDGTKVVLERDSPNFANFYVITINADGSNEAIVPSGATSGDAFQPGWGTAP